MFKKFCKALYEMLLKRQPEPGALEHWDDAMKSGLSYREVLAAFLNSDEFKNKNKSSDLLFVPPGHFYSPIVDTSAVELLFDDLWKRQITSIDIGEKDQVEMWAKFMSHFLNLPFTSHRQDGYRYYYDNPAYGIGDASIYFAMLLEQQPKRIIEIGSGFSSACALDTVEKYFKHQVDFTFIEPYPELLYSLLSKDDRRSVKVLPVNIQNVDINIFKALEAGDILFIDSTHVLKTGSDVHFIIFEVLPILNKDVFIHIHDMFWPFEYPRHWVIDEKRSWNELYAVRALLMYQETFKIKFFNDFFTYKFRPRIEKDYPNFLKNSGGSLWLQKVE